MEITFQESLGKIVVRQVNLGELGADVLLMYAPNCYFIDDPDSQALPVESLVLSRARPKGILNAARLMREAWLGQQPKRAPIMVEAMSDGRFLVVDGNSTVLKRDRIGLDGCAVRAG